MATGYTTSNATTTGSVWSIWTSASDTSGMTSATSIDNVWLGWTASGGSTSATSNRTFVAPQPRLTAEQIEAINLERAEQDRLRAERQEAERKRQAEANLKADKLLLSLLNRRQRKEFREKQQISIYRRGRHVPSWILENKSSRNIIELDPRDKPIRRHCVQTVTTPLSDQLATQYLYLHTNPAELLRVAVSSNLQ
jgi:hypothetical protein